MSDSSEALNPPAARRDRSIKARRKSRRAKAERERRIVNWLNADVSVADIAARDTPRRLLSLAQEQFGRADVLVNNAGSIAAGSIDTIDLDAINQMTRVNAWGLALMSR